MAEEVELTAAAPMMDKLTRLIKHAKDRTNSPYKSVPLILKVVCQFKVANPSQNLVRAMDLSSKLEI